MSGIVNELIECFFLQEKLKLSPPVPDASLGRGGGLQGRTGQDKGMVGQGRARQSRDKGMGVKVGVVCSSVRSAGNLR